MCCWTCSPTNKLWGDWSAAHLATAFDAGPVLINPLIYAEPAVGFNRIEDLDEALPERIERENPPWDAAFLAARCFLQYRRDGDDGRALLTRDRPRHLDLLPSLRVISSALECVAR